MSNTITLTELDMEYELPFDYRPNTMISENYIEDLIKINKLPFSKAEIYYSDDVWNFAPYTTLNVNKNKMKFKFFSFNIIYKNDIKNYSLFKVLDNKIKVQSISKYLYTINRYLSFTADKNVFHIKDITVPIIKEYLDKVEKDESPIQLRLVKTQIKDFYMVYAANFENVMTPEMDRLFHLGDYQAFKAMKKEAKLPDIPKDYFDSLIASCIVVMNDEKADLIHRAVACVIIIISQTGLRIGECLSLTDNCLLPIKIFNGEESNYITYKTWKRESGNNTSTTENTYVNELTKTAYLKLLYLHGEKRKLLNMNYLFMGGPLMNDEKHFPIDGESFQRFERRFFAYMNKYLPTINVPANQYPGIDSVSIRHLKGLINKYPGIETLTFPKNHQFRVHVCTELYNRGVPLKYIEKFMAHLSTEMQGYYVRSKDNPQENMEFSIKTFNEIVTGEIKLLGGSNGFTDKLKEFIIENHYSVEKDLNTICQKLAEQIPVRQKTGGVCIKSSMLRECSNDAKTNQFYCAYGVCPNIFHFYYMADVSYRQAKELVQTITINKSRGHLKQVQKEINMLNNIIDKKLIPELDELKNMTYKKSVDAILIDHPELQEIIENFEIIEREVASWRLLK